ncbi:MAG TPA: ectoine hydroxylase [Streptosporangiaceae bacterium]|jgi:ectoine hydroxylase
MPIDTYPVRRKPIDTYPTRRTCEPIFLFRRDPVVYGTAADGPIDDETLGSFDKNGFLTIDPLLDPDEVERYRAEMRRLGTDSALSGDDRLTVEKSSGEVRSIFEIHKISDIFAELVSDPRVVGRARQILGSDVYIHKSKVTYTPGFRGKEFFWHSDFETWHAEDGMPRMRAVSISIALTDNFVHNGGLMIMPGSHRTFVCCLGATPPEHYREALKDQAVGTPDPDSLTMLADKHGIELFTGPAGSATMFDCNCMHGSNGNITPFPRSNVFIVFNSVENTCVEPFGATSRRPSFIAARDFTAVADQRESGGFG